MAFLGLPETCKMYIFALVVHHLQTTNVNAYVSKIYPSGLIFGGTYVWWGLIFGMFIGFHIWGGAYIQGGLICGGILTGFYGI